MPKGKRRTIFQERMKQEVLPLFAGRVLAADSPGPQPRTEVEMAAASNFS